MISQIRTRGEASDLYDKELSKLDSALTRRSINYAEYLAKLNALDMQFNETVEKIKNDRNQAR